jgi:phage protein D
MSLAFAVWPNAVPDAGMPLPERVQVVEALHQPATYRLYYTFNSRDSDFPLLKERQLEPEKDLAVVAMGGASPAFLVYGPVMRHDIVLLDGGAGSSLEVTGGDLCIAMDRDDKSKVWSQVTDSSAVLEVLGQGGYNLVPDVTHQTTTMHSDFTHPLVQRETDLRFVRRLARRNGCWFWITTEAPMLNVAHFKRLRPGGAPEVEFRLNTKDANVEQVSIRWDTERPVSATLKQLSLTDKSVVAGSVQRSPLSGLASKALGDVVKQRRTAHIAVPADDAGSLTARAEALLIDSGWFVSARIVAQLSVLKKVVRAHTVARLEGAGTRHSGNYVVARVVHDIGRDEHYMTIDLVRNGWN